MDYLWEIYNEIGYKVKNVSHLKDLKTLRQLSGVSKLEKNKKIVYFFHYIQIFITIYM